MAEDAMVKESLSEEMIRDGAALITALDQSGPPASAAVWFYFPDANAWRLLIASSEVDSGGPRKAYAAAQRSLSTLTGEVQSLTLEDIAMVPPSHPLLGILRHLIKTGPGIGRMRFSRNVVNGQFIENALVYRMT